MPNAGSERRLEQRRRLGGRHSVCLDTGRVSVNQMPFERRGLGNLLA
jgi:hypothetical protein